MYYLKLLSLLLFWYCSSSNSQKQCRPDISRQACPGDKYTCENEGCCYDSTYHCYYGVIPPPTPQCYKDGPRVPCGDEYIVSDNECSMMGCCWDYNDITPHCFFPIPSYVVKSVSTTTHGLQVVLENQLVNASSARYLATPLSRLKLDLVRETSSRLHIKISDPGNPRYEIPESVLPLPSSPDKPLSNYYYDYEIPSIGEKFHMAILDRYSRKVLFNTSSTLFTFSDVFLNIGTDLPRNYSIYGLGERKSSLKLKPGRGYTLWNFNTHGQENVNSYGSHPFYMEVRDGKAHGVFLRNSNGMDVVLDNTSLTYRVIGGVLDFYFFVSEMGLPDEIIQSYLEVIGRPAMPPYWALGYHQCRQGYRNLEEVENTVGNFSARQIPLDGVWLDEDYMDESRDFILKPDNFSTKKMQRFAGDLSSKGMHLVVVLHPAINKDKNYPTYNDGTNEDIFIKDHTGKIFLGLGPPGEVAYPDFLHPNISKYWYTQIASFLKQVPADGLWLDMNEPQNYCDGDCREFTIYGTTYLINSQDSLYTLHRETTDMDTKQYRGLVSFNTHNLYGLTESTVTRQVLQSIRKGKRPFILSRSTFAGSGVHAAHWLGRNSATPSDLQFSIPGVLNFQMFGIPLVGADICGFEGNTTEELCGRWMAVGAFYPFSRNHNSRNSQAQEPYRWASVAAISRKYLAIRYSLLPYYYTLFFKAAHHDPADVEILLPSAMVLKPLLFDFHKDSAVLSLDTQFLIGSSIMVSPQLKLGTEGKSLDVYFPKAKWYDWYTHEAITDSGGEYQMVDTPIDHVPIYIRGSHIIPMQGPGLTTAESRKNPYSLIVALDVAGGSQAIGDIYLDDGESENPANYTYVQYVCEGQQLRAYPQGNGFGSSVPLLSNVTIMGLPSRPSVVSLNGSATRFLVSYAGDTLVLHVTALNIPMDTKFTLDWV